LTLIATKRCVRTKIWDNRQVFFFGNVLRRIWCILGGIRGRITCVVHAGAIVGRNVTSFVCGDIQGHIFFRCARIGGGIRFNDPWVRDRRVVPFVLSFGDVLDGCAFAGFKSRSIAVADLNPWLSWRA
jgi:hypothetical protein